DSMISGQRNDGDSNPTANQINVKQTSDSIHNTSNADPSWQDGSSGYQHTNDMDEGNHVPAHEFGHSMGLHDEYAEGPKNADGTRNITKTGPPGGLMGNIGPGSRPTSDNFKQVIDG